MKIQVPERARYLRTIWHELSRLHSHLLWLGLLADGMGFESLFMHSWRLRETILDIFEKTTGGRVIFSVCKIGGVKRDIDNNTLKEIVVRLSKLKEEFCEITEAFLKEPTAVSRLKGVGKLTAAEVKELCACGPVLRASGVAVDYRLADEDGAYEALGFKPCIASGGDCYARVEVRIKEVLQSIELIEKAVGQMPDGAIEVPVKGFPPVGEYFTRVEQPRGEAVYYVKGNGTANLERFRVRTPTNINLPFLVKVLQGCDLADVPMLILTIDPCISCCER